ncbi:receptor-transporting protein 4-like [Epinephelus moara]|uniref:receptor-transporting protein 4-like n=1 Tax=Epinephelus moara TaxID=300413 RepID=UPI00214DF2AD|nr:receptor-transporting protein 4-like [Epinephelus moara]
MRRSTDWVAPLWTETFEELLSDDNELDYGDEWILNFDYRQTDKLTTEEKKRGWKICCHNAHANFRCASCRNTWPSARVVVLFRYRLRRDRGTVLMRPFGQACRQCQDDRYVLPGFSNEEVERALLNLCAKIRKNCYGEDNDDGPSAPSNERWTKPHEAALCQACHMGICRQGDK